VAKHYRILQTAPLIAFCFFLLLSTSVHAETIYLKDGTIIRGTIKNEDYKTLLIEVGDTWQSVDKSNIESISKDTAPVEKQAETSVQAEQASAAASRTEKDLRLKFGSAAEIDELAIVGDTFSISGENSSNVQLEFNAGMYGHSNTGLILSVGLFSRTHSGNINDPSLPTTVDYEAVGLSLGAGIGIKASDHLHFEGKLEFGLGSGDGTLSSPGVVFNETESSGYTSVSIIVGAYYTVSSPGFQIGLELGTQSFSGDFDIRSNFGGWETITVEGSNSTANLVVGVRF
jgi:hypothetical protein